MKKRKNRCNTIQDSGLSIIREPYDEGFLPEGLALQDTSGDFDDDCVELNSWGELTTIEGNSIKVRLDYIVAVEDTLNSRKVILTNGVVFEVKDSRNSIMRKISFV